ncbi:MAG: hypothetical protein A2Y69_03860 [Candidatus Aminicenantes bacterium RBG_13_59_9]|nr:MAG: hypothetical protein A2Y69_03860 [Candidatus Aminicenantes bacterium RBG_13_59_9]
MIVSSSIGSAVISPRFILVNPMRLVNNARGGWFLVDSIACPAVYFYKGKEDAVSPLRRKMNPDSEILHMIVAFLAGVFMAIAPLCVSSQERSFLLSKEEARLFLLEAKVIQSERIGKGLTNPWRLTLSADGLTHDASFQDVDVRTQEAGFAGGGRELNFADSFHFNIAAYELASLLGVDDMVPITVEREWEGKKGSLSWWVDDIKMDEEERVKRAISPPDSHSWNNQMHRIRVFSQLIYDTDRNVQNILITGDWKLWIIDFTRAFRTIRELPEEEDLLKCERGLYDRLQKIGKDAVSRAVGGHLTRWEVEALMARRDLIVKRFQKLIRENGELKVLY